jgi:hypothetical protein
MRNKTASPMMKPIVFSQRFLNPDHSFPLVPVPFNYMGQGEVLELILMKPQLMPSLALFVALPPPHLYVLLTMVE